MDENQERCVILVQRNKKPMRENSTSEATGSGRRRECVRGCGPSNLVVDLDLLHASMKIRSSFAECRVQIQLSAPDCLAYHTASGPSRSGKAVASVGTGSSKLAGPEKRRVCLKAGLSAKVKA